MQSITTELEAVPSLVSRYLVVAMALGIDTDDLQEKEVETPESLGERITELEEIVKQARCLPAMHARIRTCESKLLEILANDNEPLSAPPSTPATSRPSATAVHTSTSSTSQPSTVAAHTSTSSTSQLAVRTFTPCGYAKPGESKYKYAPCMFARLNNMETECYGSARGLVDYQSGIVRTAPGDGELTYCQTHADRVPAGYTHCTKCHKFKSSIFFGPANTNTCNYCNIAHSISSRTVAVSKQDITEKIHGGLLPPMHVDEKGETVWTCPSVEKPRKRKRE